MKSGNFLHPAKLGWHESSFMWFCLYLAHWVLGKAMPYACLTSTLVQMYECGFLWLFELIIPDFWIIISAELAFWTFAFQRNICHAIQSVMCKILDPHNKLILDIFLTNMFVPWIIPHGWRKINTSVHHIPQLKQQCISSSDSDQHM